MFFRKAILIIHGFAGGTFDQEYLSNILELQKNYDVYTFTLPGHDYGLGKVKYEEWIQSAREHIEMLIKNGYKNIYLVGHSMGGVIATKVASEYKNVKKLVLAAPAFHYLNFKDDKIDIIESLKTGVDVIKEYKIDAVLARFIKVPRNALIEFTQLVKNCYDAPKEVCIPTLIIEGDKDSVVPMSSVDYVYENLKSNYKELLIVKGINHDIFRSERKEEITLEVIKFLKNRKTNKTCNIKRQI